MRRNLHRSTAQVAKLLYCRYAKLHSLIRFGRMAPPARDPGGRYMWFDGDIERARTAMANDRRRSRKAVRP